MNSGLSKDGPLISASAVPYCGIQGRNSASITRENEQVDLPHFVGSHRNLSSPHLTQVKVDKGVDTNKVEGRNHCIFVSKWKFKKCMHRLIVQLYVCQNKHSN